MLSVKDLVQRIQLSAVCDEQMLSIVPQPDLTALGQGGAASIDLRLGRWFRTLRSSRTHLLDISLGNANAVAISNQADTYAASDSDAAADATPDEAQLTKEHFVPFGERFVLHPRSFVLGVTLEWLRLPTDLGGYVTGKSSLGRRGLIIETATGIHPGFSGCLALELSNAGEVPIALRPGMRICQIFLRGISNPAKTTRSQFSDRRKPALGTVEADEILRKLKGDARAG